VPYGKMARKAHRLRRMLDGLDEQAADASFATEVEPSLRMPAQVGNIYTGSLYLALCSLLHAEAQSLVGQRLGLFSYGSGSSAEFFAGRVSAQAPALCERLQLDAPLTDRERLSVAAYEELRRLDGAPERSDRRPAPDGAIASGTPKRLVPEDAGLSGNIRYCGIDSGERRVYVTG
jgi:hydroxymethylglutaryl-CoA synthase